MLVELSMVEQRYDAVRDVLDGATVTDVATRFGVDRRTVHRWLLRYANEGLAALADRSSKPDRCPHQMTTVGHLKTLRTAQMRVGKVERPGDHSKIPLHSRCDVRVPVPCEFIPPGEIVRYPLPLDKPQRSMRAAATTPIANLHT